jgi:hypothetical protein
VDRGKENAVTAGEGCRETRAYRVCAICSSMSFSVARKLCTTKNMYDTHRGTSNAALSKLRRTL